MHLYTIDKKDFKAYFNKACDRFKEFSVLYYNYFKYDRYDTFKNHILKNFNYFEFDPLFKNKLE